MQQAWKAADRPGRPSPRLPLVLALVPLRLGAPSKSSNFPFKISDGSALFYKRQTALPFKNEFPGLMQATYQVTIVFFNGHGVISKGMNEGMVVC